MGILLDRLAAGKVLVADGAWGTMLHSKGMTSDDCPEEWNVSHPEAVQSVAAAYVEAGADIVLTDTFGGSRPKLEKMGMADRLEELNAAGAKNSLAVIGDSIVGASVGPTGEFMEPLGLMTEEQMTAVFAEQIKALIDAGAPVICIETMSAIEEACCAVKAAKSIDANVDVCATMTFEKSPTGYHTMMGVTPAAAVEQLTAAGADVVGSNCGNGIEQMIEIAEEMRAANAEVPLLFNSNAGLPEIVKGETVFRMTPEEMAAKVPDMVAAGANIIGGCCGTTPAHIAAIKAAL
jgi:5-methyltetrahydrofolate--homocysteine methyltransferase